MQENQKTQNRPEQIRLLSYLEVAKPAKYKLEHYIYLGKIKDFEETYCIADIADLTSRKVYRLNGQIHESKKQQMKLEDQRYMLENNGWIVFDIWFWDFPLLFAGKDGWKDECYEKGIRFFSP